VRAIEVAYVFRCRPCLSGCHAGHLSLDQIEVMSASERCAAALGGRVGACQDCRRRRTHFRTSPDHRKAHGAADQPLIELMGMDDRDLRASDRAMAPQSKRLAKMFWKALVVSERAFRRLNN